MSFEIAVPTDKPLYGFMEARVVDINGDSPDNIINIKDAWVVDFHWHLHGPMAKCITGKWCLHVHLESIGKGPELSLFEGRDVEVELDPCGDGHYQYRFDVKAGTVTADACSTPYRVVATLTYRTPCDKPGPMAGFADLGMVQFYEGEH